MASGPTFAAMPDAHLRRIYEGLASDPRRERAFEAFEAIGIPHRRVEGWRWSDVRAALKSSKGKPLLEAQNLFAPIASAVFRFDDDGFTPPVQRPPGVQFFEEPTAMAFASAEDMPLGALAAALSNSPCALVIDIAADTLDPIHLIFEGGAAKRFAHVVVVVREGVNVTVLESHLAEEGFSSVAVEYDVRAGARLDRVAVQTAGSNAVQVISARGDLEAGARFVQTVLATGARLARFETRIVHHGPGASAVLNGAYLLGEGRHADLTSYVRHSAEGCETRQVTKGAVKTGGRGVYQGKFYVARGAQRTDASMEHHALLLENGAEVDAKPELEIYADDVQCAHGNTAGALDADAVFYMRQRGISLNEARALLTQSFIAEAFEAVEAEFLHDLLLEGARQWLTATL